MACHCSLSTVATMVSSHTVSFVRPPFAVHLFCALLTSHPDSSAVVHWVESGSNGLVLDPEQALLYVMEHGNRQVSVLDLTTHEKRAILTHYKGKRFHR